jgi:hypothetical protein
MTEVDNNPQEKKDHPTGDDKYDNYGSRFARDEEGRTTNGAERREFQKDAAKEPPTKGTPVDKDASSR